MSLDEEYFRTTFNIESVNVINELKSTIEKIHRHIDNLINFISKGIAV